MTDRAELREKVARACALAVEKQYSDLQAVKALGFESVEAFVDRAWPNYLPQADAAIAIVLEEAARVAEGFPARTHGNLSVDPFEAAEQAANECAAAIRALISPADAGQSLEGELGNTPR